MDYQVVFDLLCKNFKAWALGKITKEEFEGYKQGVFDTLFELDLTEEYYDWCDKNDIPPPDFEPEDESYLGYT